MRTFLSPILAAVLALLVVGCDSFVEEVDNPIDTISDEQLTTESQVPFLITGVQARFSTTHDRLALYGDGLSDQFFFDQRVPNATFPSFREIDEGDITFANNSVDGVYNDLGELRFFSDNLLERVAEIDFEDQDLRRKAEFTGNLYGGLARYFYATYIGLTPRQGGGIISPDPDNPGPFVPSDQMYDLALEKLNAALALAGDDYERRVVNTLIARIHLFEGNFGEARAAAQQGLQEGDPDFATPYSVEQSNQYYVQAGQGRTQWVVDFRYQDIVEANPAEAARIPLEVILGNDGTDTTPPTTFYRQAKYTTRESPLPLATWQENALILAEVDLRSGGGDALARVNAVRASHGLDPLDAVDLDVLLFEREKELFATGLRLPDQRRFDTWHLGPETWQFLPITQSERNQNPNI